MIIQLHDLQTFSGKPTYIRMNDHLAVGYEKLKSLLHYLLSNNPGYKQGLSLFNKRSDG